MEAEKEVAIIVCHHTGTLIDRCLHSISQSYSTGLSIKTIVVTSTTRVFPGTFTIQEQGGPAHKRNVGVSYSKAEYIVFLDDDVEVSPYCVWNLVNEMEKRPQCGMGFAKIMNMERRDEFDDCGSWITPTGFLFARAGNRKVERGQFNSPSQCLASKSATCIARRSSYLEAGGFDSEYYILGEETDLAWRMWLKGWEAWYLPSAKSWHAFGTSLKPKAEYYTLERIHFHGCKNYINILSTNLGLRRLLCVIPIHLSIWVASAAGFALRGQLKRSWLILKGIWWNIIHIQKTLQKRRNVQGSRVITDSKLWPMISYSPGFKYYTDRLRRYVTQGLHG